MFFGSYNIFKVKRKCLSIFLPRTTACGESDKAGVPFLRVVHALACWFLPIVVSSAYEEAKLHLGICSPS